MFEKKDRVEEETIVEPADEEAEDLTEEEEPSREEWEKALTETVAKRDEYLALAQRTMADFQNYKKRNAHARTDGYDDGVRDIISSLLPAMDAMEIGIATAHQRGDEGPVLDGLTLVHKQLTEALQKYGLEEVPALNETFDPEYHNAVMREHSAEPGKVMEVFQKGYRVKGRILRYAMVKVGVDEK